MWNTSGAGGQAFFLLTGKLAGYCRIHYANKATFAGFRYIKALSPCSPSQPHPLSPLEKSKAFTIWTETSSLFSPLNLCRDPIESLKVMALWLWLEQFGFNNIVKTISSLPHFLINEFADEAMLCINYLSNSHLFTLFPEPINLPLTQSLLGADVPSNFFPENRVAAILGIRKTLTGVCLRALSDLLQKAIERNTARALTETQISMSTLIESGFSRLNINNFGNRMSYIPRVNKPLGGAVHPDDRTMFVTFSKGYPVSERDIREFFNLIYGDCIESLHMREVQFAEQSLYARIVFNTPNVIKYVLNGAENTKFTVKGRHMWVRKFVPNRRRHISLSPCMPGAGSSQGL